jgi:peptidoglycan/LPS O-acetylase OafA/YrhL
MSSWKDVFSIRPGQFRLFLAALVVLHHSFPFRMGSWAVYVFFILSGYWISKMWKAKYVHTRQPYLTYMISRWWRLAPVFLAVTGLGAVNAWILYGEPGLAASVGWWFRQALIVGSADVGRILPPTWSLDVEMQFYILAPLLVLIFTRSRIVLLIGAILMGVGILCVHLKSGASAETPNILLYVSFFLAGLTLDVSNWKPRQGIVLVSVILTGLIFLLLLWLPETRSTLWSRGADEGAHSPWTMIGLALAAVTILPYVAHNVHVKSPGWDRSLGDLAYPLYLFHWLPREWYYRLVDWGHPAWQNMLLLLANLAVAFLGAILIWYFVDKPMDARRALWVKGRRKSVVAALNEYLPI